MKEAVIYEKGCGNAKYFQGIWKQQGQQGY